ncbi:MAG TPA: hypothetical protein DIC34_04560 [Treponema sp.]|nr:hypothetical protein [Treponema sp.]
MVLTEDACMKYPRHLTAPLIVLAGIIQALFSGCTTMPSRAERIALEQFRQTDGAKRLALWPVPYKERLIPTRFGTTYAIESGRADGQVMLLVHAMGFNAMTWAPNIDSLGKDYRVIALDTIGDQGKSVVRRDYPKTGAEYADWMVDIIDSLGEEKVVLVGCSMGGWIALNTAVEYPSRVSALVLNSPAAGLPVKTTWMKYLNDIIFTSSVEKHRKAARFLLGNGRATRDWVEYMVEVVADTGGAKMGIPSDIKAEKLALLDMPILLLVGTDEVIYENKQAVFETGRSLLPSVHCEWIPDAGHMGHYDNPDFVNSIVEEFLAGKLVRE